MIIVAKVAATVKEAILEVFGFIKTTMIEKFDEHYVVVTDAVFVAATVVVVVLMSHGGDLI